MPRDGSIIFGDLIGKLDVLRVVCDECGRKPPRPQGRGEIGFAEVLPRRLRVANTRTLSAARSCSDHAR
jgi:hypothetical protein